MRFRSTDKYRHQAAGVFDRAAPIRSLAQALRRPGQKWPHTASRAAPRSASGATPNDGRDPLRRVEAVLFLAREPISSRKLSWYANLADGTEARTLIRRLNEDYDRSGSAFRVEEVGGGFQLLTRAQFAPWLRRLEHAPAETRLSTPAMETLAVIAYRQPVLRAEIEAIRGVGCGEVLRQLMERDMVRIAGRSDELGRPYLYGTTRRFLQIFGLRSPEDLPRAASLKEPVVQPPNYPAGRTDPIDGFEEELEVSVTAPDENLNEQRRAAPVSVLPISETMESDDWEEEGDDDLEDEEDEDEEDDDFEEEEEFDEEFEDDDFEDDDDWEEVEDDDEEEEDDEADWEDDDFEDDDEEEEFEDEEEEEEQDW